MSNYIQDMFTRTDLRQIREFLLHGAEALETESDPYHIRLKQGSDAIYERLKDLYPDEEKRDEANGDLSQALSVYESVYIEIGMKAGARILYQLLLKE